MQLSEQSLPVFDTDGSECEKNWDRLRRDTLYAAQPKMVPLLASKSSRKLLDEKRLSNAGYVHSRGLIHPRAPWKSRWDILVGLVIVYSVIMIPYHLVFSKEQDLKHDFVFIATGQDMVDFVVDLVFMIDMVLNFLTGTTNA